jgi:hypothetical protein
VRVVTRIVGAAVLLGALLVVAVAVVLPRMLDTAAVRQQLADIAEPALGRRPEFQELEFQLFPPVLRMTDTTPAAGGDPSARPQRIELSIALPPLLAGVVLIDAAVVEDAQLVLLRTASGFQWDGSNFAHRDPSHPMKIALRHLALRNTAIAIDDRSVRPSVRWQLRDVEATVVAESLDSPVRLALTGEVASGGRIVAGGSFSLAGDVDLQLEFAALAIAVARPYFESNSEVSGALTGSIRVRGSMENPTLELDATLRDARLQLGDISLRGILEVDARVDDARSAPRGKIELDATRAEVSYAQFFTKPPGTAATVVGIVSADRDGSPAIKAWKFSMKDLDGHVRIRFADRLRLAIAAIPAGKRARPARRGGPASESAWPDEVPPRRLQALGG